MSIPLSIAIYFICWWMVLFMILPIGTRTQREEGEVLEGTPESAPVNPQIWKKVIITTVVSAFVFVGVYAVIVFRVIDINKFPL
ncbi:MAG: DUF1467 family protein [Methyloligellaceae bacterium]